MSTSLWALILLLQTLELYSRFFGMIMWLLYLIRILLVVYLHVTLRGLHQLDHAATVLRWSLSAVCTLLHVYQFIRSEAL